MLYPSLYQINTRVYLNELAPALGRPATLADWPREHLDWLQDQGFDWLWPLGIWQTGPAGRQVSRSRPDWLAGYRKVLPDFREEDICGSPYAVQSYHVHTDFGGDEALARFRERLQRRGIKLLLDFVPNHVALDHPWARERPEFFIAGSEADLAREPGNYCRLDTGAILAHGRDPYFPGWPDTLQLNYRHPGLRAAMIGELQQVASRCDGVRADMAMLLLPEVFLRTWGNTSLPADGSAPVDVSFWPEALARVRTHYPSFVFLAEVYWDLEWRLQQQGFDYTYDKRLYDRLKAQAAGPVRDHLSADLSFQDHLARFLENHDEERAAAVFPPDVQRAAAVVTYLTPGLRFFHDGQFEGRRRHTSIHLGRRAAEPAAPELQAFYGRLLECLKRRELRQGRWQLRSASPAWDGNGTWQNFLAFTWEGGPDTLLACVNYGPTQGQCYVPLPLHAWRGRKVYLTDLLGPARYERDGDQLNQRGLYLDLPAWGGHLFTMSTEPAPADNGMRGEIGAGL
jgi:glycosidase